MGKREEFYININDYSLHAIREVKNRKYPYIIFLHDALGSVETWRSFPFDLTNNLQYNVLVYSRRGHGKSDCLTQSKGLDLFEKETAELHYIVQELALNKIILIGSSDGGTIALNYASRHEVLALVSIAGHYMNENATFIGVQSSTKEPFNTQLRLALKKYHNEKSNLLVDSWQNVWTHNSFKSWSLQNNMINITCPVLIIQGKKDEYATDSHAESLGSLISNSVVCLLDDVGHFPHKENPLVTTRLIEGFLYKNNI